MIELKKETERVILVGVCLPGQKDIDASLEELSELAKTAGAVTVGKVVQSRDQVHPGTYVGKGKIDEIKSLLWELDATGIICDDELSPAQMKNLQDELDAKVMDRTLVILDIFAARASTSEGKIQVELAQLKYRQTRLAGFGTAMSRLGGSPLDNIQYELICKQFDCMASYLSWDMLFQKCYYANARDELAKDVDAIQKLENLGKNV